MIEMKKKYEELELEIIRFDSEDVITASKPDNETNEFIIQG